MQFSSTDQQIFSEVSGDRNPIHLNPSWAEKVFPGKIVVFGVLIVLRVLEELSLVSPFLCLKVKFIKPVFQGEEVSFTCTQMDDGIEIKVFIEKDVAIKIQLLSAASVSFRNSDLDQTTSPVKPSECEELTFDQIRKASGAVKVTDSAMYIESLFPNCCRQIGLNTVQGLLALSQVIGMRCPGRRGLFSSFKLMIQTKIIKNSFLSYKCVYANKSLGFSRLEFTGYGIEGVAEAYFTLSKVRSLEVPPQSTCLKYTNSNALIVGGSGLGHACALLLANGGAKVCVTSRSIPDKGTPISPLLCNYRNLTNQTLDVTDATSLYKFMDNINEEIRSVYYFPTPRIFRRRLKTLSEDDTYEFMNLYVFSFVRLIESLYVAKKCSRDVSIFYPSSIAIEEANPDLFEYYISKLAGEEACSLLKKKYPQMNIVVVRLPRLETGQTNSFIQTSSSDNLNCLAEIVKVIEANSN